MPFEKPNDSAVVAASARAPGAVLRASTLLRPWLGGAALLIAACGGSKSAAPRAAASAEAATPPVEETAPPVEEAALPVEEAAPPVEEAATEPVAAVASVPATDPVVTERAAYERARPVFDKYCAACHTKTGKNKRKRRKAMKHFTMDAYPFGGHHAMEIGEEIRESLGIDGSKPTMPKDDPGVLSASELALVADWSRAFDVTHPKKAGGHGDHDHDHGKKKHDKRDPGNHDKHSKKKHHDHDKKKHGHGDHDH